MHDPHTWPLERNQLLVLGVLHLTEFCQVNNIPVPLITTRASAEWPFAVCAYYRHDGYTGKRRRIFREPEDSTSSEDGINICLEKCANPASITVSRNWSWPGSVIGREPFGVLCHELGHHCDWLTGEKKWAYGSEYSTQVMDASGEKKLTNYCDNPAEWFAEMFRLFVSNHALLKELRPRTHALLCEKWQPISLPDWRAQLGANVPDRIVQSLLNKINPKR